MILKHKTPKNYSLNPAFTHVQLNLLYDANSVKRLISVNPWTRINEGREENFTPPELPTRKTPIYFIFSTQNNPAFTHVRLNLLYDANSVKRNPSTRINEGFTPPEELTTARIGTKCKQGETMRDICEREQTRHKHRNI